MDGDNIGRLFYLILLGMAVGGWFIAENRQSLGKTARQAAAWGLIFVGVIAGVGLWSDISRDVLPTRAMVTGEGQIEVPLANDGHYYLTLRLIDAPVRFMVDTGASAIVLSRDDAERAGLDPSTLSFLGRADTANGMVRTANARIDEVTLGDITDRNVRVSVNGGDMDGSLLGMPYLSRFEKVEIEGRKLMLTRWAGRIGFLDCPFVQTFTKNLALGTAWRNACVIAMEATAWSAWMATRKTGRKRG